MAPLSHPEPLSSLQQLARSALSARQQSQSQPIIVPATYTGLGANGGEVAGITLGVVFGIVLVLIIISSVTTNPFRPVIGTSSVVDVGRKREGGGGGGGGGKRSRAGRTERTRSTGRKTARSRSRSAVSAREEMTEFTGATSKRGERGGGGGRSPRRARETIIVEESRRESRPPPPPEDDLAYGDDIVEVIEEESDISPARRPRRSQGYRNVDPEEYGGGGRPMRKVRR